MDTNINYTLVGAFMIVLIATFVLAIIWLSSGFSFEHYTSYAIFSQESVSGLSIDAPVEFNGVEVGTVKSIQLDAHNPKLVEVVLNVKSSTPVSQGTTATLTSRGITGITFVALKDLGDNFAPLEKMKGQDYPVIKTAPSLMMRLDIALKNLSENIKSVSQSISTLLDPENQKSIKSILLNMNHFTAMLSTNSDKMASILQNTSKASLQLVPLIQSSTNTIKALEIQTLPATYRLLNNLDAASRTLSDVASEVKKNPSVLIRGSQPQPLGPGEKR